MTTITLPTIPSPEQLQTSASDATGLDDFGSGLWTTALDQLVSSMNEEARLNEVGQMAATAQLTDILVHHLRLRAWQTAHREIEDQVIEAPLVVTGLPRTGSTFLSSLLNAVDSNRSLLMWEAINPTPVLDVEDRGDDRRELADIDAAMRDALMPDFKSMHHMAPDEPEECIWLVARSFMSQHVHTTFEVPSFVDWLATQDITAAYEAHRAYLQLLQWPALGEFQGAGTDWTLKAPQHMSYLPQLRSVYPDARFVITHRNPADAIASAATMIDYTRRTLSDHSDPNRTGVQLLDMIADGVDALLDHRANNDPEPFLDLHQADLIADPVGSVERVHAHAGRKFTGADAVAIEGFLTNDTSRNHARKDYSLADVGLTPAAVEERFARYLEVHPTRTSHDSSIAKGQ